jgi:hypothetical protein
MTPEKKIEQAMNQILCAQTNLANIGKIHPMIESHPYFKIVDLQIQSAINALNGIDVESEDHDDAG